MEWFSVAADIRRRDRPTLVVVPEPPTSPPSVALLAGSFDPITVAHAAMAEAAGRFAELVVLVYSVRPMPKDDAAAPPLLEEGDRLAWLERFCETRPGVAVGLCSHGLLADQVEAGASRFPDARLFVAMGSDKLLQVLDPSWYDDREVALARLFGPAEVLVATRAGDEGAMAEALARPENSHWRRHVHALDVPSKVAAVSSRRVRELLAEGRDVGELIPPEVRPLLR